MHHSVVGPRSSRGRWLDVLLVGSSVLVGLLLLAVAADQDDPPPDAWLVADVVAGSVCCLALGLRRRRPVGVAVVVAVLGAASATATGALLVALFGVAVHRRWPTVLAVTGLAVAGNALALAVRPGQAESVGSLLAGVLLTSVVIAWAMVVRARRELVASLRERAERAEAEQELRIEQARTLERTRIAREMHDVLAHRLSLVSMHAGALEFRPDAAPEAVTRAAGVIRAGAHQALEDLRQVIGVLRASPGSDDGDRPQPTLADLPALVEESRQAGLRIRSEADLPAAGTPPGVVGRTAYRVVQEGLTNARKHAPGAAVTIHVDGGPGSGLAVELRNPAALGDHPADGPPGSGTGLVGLRERVTLAGGRLEHGWTPTGEFRLRVDLPWPT